MCVYMYARLYACMYENISVNKFMYVCLSVRKYVCKLCIYVYYYECENFNNASMYMRVRM